MSEDRLLRELGHLAKEEEGAAKARLDERWDRLAAGTLTAEEEAELLALAETSPEAREAYEAFRPLGADFQARVVEAAAAELPKPKPSPLPFRPARIGGWLTAAAAVAACLFVLLRSPASMPALPVYTAELSSGDKILRGDDEPDPVNGQPVFASGSTVTLVARPQKSFDGRELEARGFFSPQTGKADLTPWKPEIEIVDNGTVRLTGTLGEEIQIPPGAWTVWVVIARQGKIPSASELQSELLAGRTQHTDWQALHVNLLVEDRPPS
jgi:hypothetical protein